MSSSRSEFLKGLRARLQSDIALREAEREDEAREDALERIDEPGVEYEHPREEFADDPIDTAAAFRAARSEPELDAGAESAGRMQLPHQPGDTMGPIGSSPDREEDPGAYPSATWAEAGMPLRLRDAIASVRRVSHELYQGAPRDQEAMAAPPFAGNGGKDEFFSDSDPRSGSSWDDGSRFYNHPADGHGQILADQNDSPSDELLFGDDPTGRDSLPINNQLHELGRAFQHEHIEPDDRATSQEPMPATEFALEHDEHAPMLDAGVVYRGARKGAEAPRERLRSDDDEGDEEPSPSLPEDLHDRLPARRRTTAGYGVHLTALTAAIVFVALAGFGFAMLSDTAPPKGHRPHSRRRTRRQQHRRRDRPHRALVRRLSRGHRSTN